MRAPMWQAYVVPHGSIGALSILEGADQSTEWAVWATTQIISIKSGYRPLINSNLNKIIRVVPGMRIEHGPE
jgi:hypothetical protein